MECISVASGCSEQEVGVASGSGWNLWVWLQGVVVRRYIDFLILLIPTPLVSVLFTAASLLFVQFFKMFFVLYHRVGSLNRFQQYRQAVSLSLRRHYSVPRTWESRDSYT